ncbi:MAG: LLM class flavin-dependent oxidoreductase [Actinomycetota bacterium]
MALGVCFDRTFPASAVAEHARAVEAAGLDELWFIEDCFFTAGISLAATALASTERLTVGLGVMPAVARNPAITAMEIATLCDIAPGRFVPGIGHGVQEWMDQMGARTPSPLATLDETISTVTRLLAGEEVSFSGREVSLDRVRLDRPPVEPPPILAGVQQPKSLALAGRVAGGVVLAEGVGPTYLRGALAHAGRQAADGFEVATFTLMSIEDDPREAAANVAPFVAGLVLERRPALTVLPFFDELLADVTALGPDALIDLPAERWIEIGAIGTFDHAVAHVEALTAAGATSINVFPGPDLDLAREQIADVARIASHVR